jgi:hypothetical protein
MNPDLEAIRDAMDPDIGGGRDADQARTLSDTYITDHPAEFGMLETMTLESCVAAVDLFRDTGDEASRLRVETWLLHRWEPRQIGGNVEPTLRTPGQE